MDPLGGGAAGLVFVHGFAGAPASWDALIDALAPRRVPTWRVTLPGHAPAFPVAPGFAANVDAVAQQIRRRCSPPVRLVGYSMGARVSLGLLAQHPRLCAGLVLIGCHPGLTEQGERRERVQADRDWARLLRERGIEAFVAAWERLPLFASQLGLPSSTLRRQRDLRLGHEPELLAACLEQLGLGQMPDFRQTLHGAPVPIRLVVGARDHKFLSLARELARADEGRTRIPSLTVLPACGHNPLLEAPSALASALCLG